MIEAGQRGLQKGILSFLRGCQTAIDSIISLCNKLLLNRNKV